MKLMRKLTHASMKQNPLRTIVTILGIALSTALVTSVLTLFSCGREAVIDYKKTQDGNWHVAVFDADANEIDHIADLEEVSQVSRVKEIGFSRIEGIKNEYKPYVRVRAYDHNALQTLGVRMIEGRLPQTADEIVIPSHLYTNGRFKDWKVGDTIQLELGQRKIDDTLYPLYLNEEFDPNAAEELVTIETRTYTIVGRMERPSYLIENFTAAGYTCITALGENNAGESYTCFVRLGKSALSKIEAVVEKLTGKEVDYFGRFGYSYLLHFDLIELEESLLSSERIVAMALAGAVALGIIMVASMVCIRNSFAISINEKVHQYGMLCSIGATKRQVKRNVLYEAFLLGIVAIPLGMLLGLAASGIMVHVSNYYIGRMVDELGLLLKFTVNRKWLAAGAALSTGTVFLSALSGVFIASRVSPIDAIRMGGERRAMPFDAMRIRFKDVCTNIALQNHHQSRRKYRTTVLSIMTCVALFIAMSAFVTMFYHQIRIDYDTVQYDLEIGFDSSTPEDYETLIAKMVAFDGIERFSFRKDNRVELLNPKYTERFQKTTEAEKLQTAIWVFGVSDEELQRLADEIGCRDDALQQKAIMINTELFFDPEMGGRMLKKFEYRAGDCITVKRNEDLPETMEINLAAVTDRRSFSISGTSDAILVVGEEVFDRIVGNRLNNIKFYYKADDPGRIQDEAEEYLYSDEIKNVVEGYENLGRMIYNASEQRRNMEAFITLLSIFLYGFIIVIAFIGVTNIINIVITNTERRKSEYAMLCSVGMANSQLLRMIGMEHLMIGGTALLTGIPIGFMLSYVLGILLEVNYFLIPWQGIVMSVFAVALLLAVLTRLSYVRFRKQNIIETIRARDI